MKITIDRRRVGRHKQRGDIKLDMAGKAEIVTDTQRVFTILVKAGPQHDQH